MKPKFQSALERSARWFVVLAIVALAALSVIAAKALLADGPYYMLGILENDRYLDFDRARSFAMIITQTPVVVAIRMGERDVITLIYLFSLGLIGIPALLWTVALAIQWRSSVFWILAIGFCVTQLTSGFCSISEYNLAYALTAFCFSVMLRPSLGLAAGFALVLAACVLMRAYESTAYLGPLLAVIAGDRIRNCMGRASRAEIGSLAIALVLFAAGAAIAAWSITHPRDPANLANAADMSWLRSSWQLAFTALVVAICVCVGSCPPRARAVLAAIAIAASVAYAITPAMWSSAEMNYRSRTVSGLMLFAILAVAWWRHRSQRAVHAAPESAMPALALMLFAALSVPAFVNTWRFGAWLKSFERVALARTDWIPIDQTPAGREGGYLASYPWGWTSPSLSIVLRANSDGGLLNSPAYSGWDPFDPRKLPANPLRAYTRDGELFSFGQ